MSSQIDLFLGGTNVIAGKLITKAKTDSVLTNDEFRAFLKALGVRIKQLRKGKNFSMRDIMISTGYYDAQWRKYEAGGSLNISSLMKIALALDVTLVELLDGLGQWPKLSVESIQQQNGIVPDLELELESELEPVPIPSRSPKAKKKKTAKAKKASKTIPKKSGRKATPRTA